MHNSNNIDTTETILVIQNRSINGLRNPIAVLMPEWQQQHVSNVYWSNCMNAQHKMMPIIATTIIKKMEIQNCFYILFI